MTQYLDRPVTVRPDPEADPAAAVPAAHWRVAGWLALVHVVALFGGIALQDGARIGEGRDGIVRAYVEGDMARTMTGGYVELLGFVAMLPVLVFLARVVGRRTEAGRWAAQTALLAGLGYLVLTFAPGMAAGAAAMHAAQNGVDVDTAWVLNNLRVLSYVISFLFLGTHAIGLGVAALTDRRFARWIGWGGVLTGAALFVSVPLTALDLHDLGTLVWLVWWVGVAVLLLRHRTADE